MEKEVDFLAYLGARTYVPHFSKRSLCHPTVSRLIPKEIALRAQQGTHTSIAACISQYKLTCDLVLQD